MRSLSETLNGLPAERRVKIEARAKDVIKRQNLRQMREALGKTQADVALGMGAAQNNVARMEKKGDMLVSTVSRYVKSAGGRLRIMAEMPNGGLVELTLGADGQVKAKQALDARGESVMEPAGPAPRRRRVSVGASRAEGRVA